MKDYKEIISLSETESIQYAEKLMSEILVEEELSEEIVKLSLYTNGVCLQNHYPKLIEKEIFYPCEIYLHAKKEIADIIIKLIETKNTELNVNHLLICLAWIGTENVINFFLSSSNEKPNWTKELYVLPIKYADQAGWIIDSNNKKRNLINSKVISLTKESGLIDSNREIKTFQKHTEKCPFCKNNLIKVFEIELNSEAYNSEITTCMICSCYEPVYMRIDNTGKSNWYENNQKWEYLTDDMELEPIEENILKLSTEKRKAEYTISQFSEISKSQIGGFPTWVQDAEYLDCPNCKSKMEFVGQIDMEDVDDYGEGIYYFHNCSECKITGTNYQQT